MQKLWDPESPLDRITIKAKRKDGTTYDKKESLKSNQALVDYWMMGPGRSLRKLHQKYIEQTSAMPPTRHLRTLLGWSTEFQWQDRIADQITLEKAQGVQMREEIMRLGLAVDHNRVIELKSMADLLIKELYDNGKLWVEDVKQIGGGLLAEKVTIYRYNSALIDNLRGILDDLAKETGGRKQTLQHTGAGGGPIQTEDVTMDDLSRAHRIGKILERIRERANRDSDELNTRS